MAWLSAWAWLIKLGCEEAVVAACRFGSVHRKEFRLFCYLLSVKDLEARCLGGHKHIQIAGRFTKGPEKMAIHIAKVFKEVVNDLLVARQWEVERSWHWKKRAHISL